MTHSPMKSARPPRPPVDTIDTHTAGEPTRIVLNGDDFVTGRTVAEKRRSLQGSASWLRRGLMWEPRGHKDMFGAVLVASGRADLGVVFMEHGGCPGMCIHGSIGVVTAVLEQNLLPHLAGRNELSLETPAGLVRAVVERTTQGGISSVSVEQPPARVVANVPINAGADKMDANVVGSAGWVSLIHERDAGVRLAEDPTAALVARALELRPLIIAQLQERQGSNELITDEGLADMPTAPLVFYGRSERPGCQWRTFVMFGDGSVDRSPCGFATGNLAVLLTAGGLQTAGKAFGVEGSSGGSFTASAVPARAAAGTPGPAYVPTVSGSASITGFHRFVFAEDDEFREGFSLL